MEHFPQPENHLKHSVKTKPSTRLATKATETMTVLSVENRRSEWLILVPFFTDTHYRKQKHFPSNLDIEHAPPAMKLQRFQSFWLSIITLLLQGGDLWCDYSECSVSRLWLAILTSMKAVTNSTDKASLDWDNVFFHTILYCFTHFILFLSWLLNKYLKLHSLKTSQNRAKA